MTTVVHRGANTVRQGSLQFETLEELGRYVADMVSKFGPGQWHMPSTHSLILRGPFSRSRAITLSITQFRLGLS